jgi:hypothetical protein
VNGDEQRKGRLLRRGNLPREVAVVELTTVQRAAVDDLLARHRVVMAKLVEDLPRPEAVVPFLVVKALASGMFPDVGDGVLRNPETGVEIVELDFFDEPTGDYEVRRPALNDHGYEVVLTAESIGEAVDEACAQVYSMRQVIAHDRREADTREAFALLHRSFPRWMPN